MEEQKEGGMPSYVVVITGVLIAVILIVLVTAVVLLAIGSANNPSSYDVSPTEATTITIEETPMLEQPTEAETTPESTPEIETTPEGTPSA
jgi:hypothetical protein